MHKRLKSINIRKMQTILKLSLCLITLLLIAACSEQKQPQTPTPLPASASQEPSIDTIQGLMINRIDPSADGVWNAVSSTITETGIEEHQPQTEQEWAEVRRRAVDLIDAAVLLGQGGRPVAPPGTKSENPGVEESPEAIQQLIDSQPQVFAAFAQQLKARTEEALAAIDAKNPSALLEVGGRIDEVCEGCHKVFWYPHQFKQ